MTDSAHDAHARGMQLALREAERALDHDDVPVGAVVMRGDEVVGAGHNRTRVDQDATLHAEIVAIRAASEALGSWWLEDCVLYVTLEPCAMCAGAMVLARIPHLVYGATDPKAGACGSLRNIVEDRRLNHRLDVTRGVLEPECGRILKDFFRARR